MPSGHTPAQVMRYPTQHGGIDCHIETPKEAVQQLQEFLEEETGVPRNECFQWYSEEFEVVAELAYEEVGKPELTLDSEWDVFSIMAPIIVGILL